MKRVILIILSVIGMAFLIFYFGFKTNQDKYSEFENSGYIISKVYDTEGNFIKSEKYYFSGGTKYKENYSNQVEFENVNAEKTKVAVESFVHYDNGSISSLKKAAILNLDTLNNKQAIKYYNIYPNTIMDNKNNIYSVNNIKTKLEFTNFIMKISDTKYIVVGKNLKLVMQDKEKTLDSGYYELEFIEGDIVRIENNEISLQNVPTNVRVDLANGIAIDLGNKYIFKEGEAVMNLNEITIDSDDNIQLIPELEEEEEEEEKKNPIAGLGDGIVNTDRPDDEEEVNENERVTDPIFTVVDMNVTSNKFQADVQVVDASNLLVDDISLKIIDSSTNKIVYQAKEMQGTMNFGLEVENLAPNTNYIFVVNSAYSKNGNDYTRDFVQKTFLTESVGVEIEKDYFTTDTLSFLAKKKNYSNIKSFDATLLQEERVIGTKTIEFNGVGEIEFNYEELENNTEYTLRISNYLYEDSVITDSYIEDTNYKTLKQKPNVGNVSYVIDKKNSVFTLKLSNTVDVDNGITSFRYEIYDARVLEDMTPVQVIEKNKSGSVDVRVDDVSIERGIPYTFKVVAIFNDNEKEYEYETEYSDILKMDGVAFPSIKFNADEITFEKIKGNIVIIDDGNTIALDESSKMTIVYTDSVGVQKTITASGNLTIPININYLRKNETYTFSVYAKVDLQDGNPVIDNCYIGSTIVRTEDTDPMYLTYTIDTANTDSAFKVNAKLGPYNDNDTLLEASTMSGLIFNLYEGTSTSGTLVKSVRKVDRNLDEYVSELQEEYYDKTFAITPALFNIKNQDLKAEYYTIEVQYAYDYTTYKNEIAILNNIITAKTVGFIPSLPDNIDNAMDVVAIRNKDAAEKHRDDLGEETIVGYKFKGYYDNSSKYARYINYKIYNALTGQLVDTIRYTVPESGTIGYTTAYLEDGTAYTKNDLDFRRGNIYYFSYDVELDLNLDGTIDSSYPSDPTVILKSQQHKAYKESPTIQMYPAISDTTSFSWKYKIKDVDSTIKENKFKYTIQGKNRNPVDFTVEDSYQTAKFTELEAGFLEVKIETANIKEQTAIQEQVLVYQYFDSVFNPSDVQYEVYNEVNRVIFAFLNYNTNDFYRRVAGAKIVFTAGQSSVTLDNLIIDNGNIIIDYADLEPLINKDITPTVYLYYDSGVTGFENGHDKMALQMINNGTSDYDGKYYYMNTATSFSTAETPEKSLFNISLDLQNSKMSVLNQLTQITNLIDIQQEAGGISYNYEILFPKGLSEKQAQNKSDATFRFDSIIPCVSLLSDTGALNIAPTLIGIKFKVNMYGAGGDRILNEKIYVEIWKTDESGITGTKVATHELALSDLTNIIYYDNLIPNTNYYFKLLADIKDGEGASATYIREQLYDVDYQTNTKNYYFKTLNNVGVSNVTAAYVATSYHDRRIRLSYNLRETIGFDRIEYDIYKIDPETGDKTKTDLLTDNDYFFDKQMTKYISIPVGSGIEANYTYEIVLRPIAKVTIDGISEDIILENENHATFVFNKLSEPYVGVSSSITLDGMDFKVNFFDTSKAVVDDTYSVTFTDDYGNDITPEEYKDVKFSTGATKKFSLTENLVQGTKYSIEVKYSINILNGESTIAPRTKKYSSTLTETDGINLGNFSLTVDSNDTSRIRLLFYDSYKLTEIDTIRYSIYASNGYSLDSEEQFTPVILTLQEGITYYYYTLSTVLPDTGQYYLQLQFLRKSKIMVEESAEYNYIK